MRVFALFIGTSLLVLNTSVLSQELPEFDPPEGGGVPSQLLLERLEGDLPGAANADFVPRRILQSALDLLKVYEGWSSKAYNDPAGYCTIGYGHLIKKASCEPNDFENKMSREEGNTLLAADTVPARKIVQRLVRVQLTRRQFGALTSFVFNVGGDNFARSTLLRRLNDGDFGRATQEMRKWIRAGGRRLQGLANRRNCEVAYFNEAALVRLPNGKIDTRTCAVGVGAAPDASEDIDIGTGMVSR
ncbi:lysozyme [Rhizobium sp. J15]|uniref:lysozyme n=1 Tax=Rhizobium sp. J15 TaxID=2035450 RepID=UPI0015965E7A|nr:lysozyme [Rhizobium sp. J15]